LFVIDAPPAALWPFLYPLCPALPDGPVTIVATNVEDAYVNAQTGGTELVTTQKKYLDAEWQAAFARHGSATMQVGAPKGAPYELEQLPRAFRVADPAERLALCLAALKEGRTPAALVATASVCMEVNDLDASARDLDEALAGAPDWAAAHYERGKLWLRADDMARAAGCFQRAADLLPTFVSAWANLGGTLGELDRSGEALAAFERALALEPANPQALNNVGVVRRELGRLAESEAAFRQVIQLTPDLAFGHYNLGHTLFLQGRFQAALSAYAAGQSRDPDRNPVQASRLALCKVATGDGAGALRDLQGVTNGLPREYRQQLLGDTSAILWAVVTRHPELEGWQPVHAWLTAEMKKA
jgi:tetratricopeptide (TPR) repeat protein